MALLFGLLPQASMLHLETWHIDLTTAQVALRVQSTQTLGHCPLCQCPTPRIHRRSRRTVADRPWAHDRVVLQLGVRKFFCTNGRCPRRIFTERLPGVVAPWARQTARLLHGLAHIAVALGGAAGAYLSRDLGGAISRYTLLRLLRRLPVPSLPTPTVLGVDDFAMRKRPTYGTILVDLTRRQPVALLPERTAETLVPWLLAPPGVEVIARDRSQAYAEGARPGVPAAMQVADRLHLRQNLRDALDQVFITHSQVLDAVNETMRPQPVPLSDGTMAVPVPPLQDANGRRDLGDRVLNPSKASLLERWNAGCHTAMRLCRELRQRGYGGSYGVVAAYARRLRQAQGLPLGHRRPRQPLPDVAEPLCPPLTPRRATWLVLRREAKRTVAEAQQLTQLHAQSAEVAEAIDLVQDFATLVRQRQPTQLDPWLTRATASTLEALRRFATGLYEDDEAVNAGVTLPWSTSPVERHINRLKRLKRPMFGRAHLDLLSRRFVRASAREQERAQPGAMAA